ncbi:MAG: hypothetical protein WCF36_07685 [Candidatus Nanopelagicales bacterium]
MTIESPEADRDSARTNVRSGAETDPSLRSEPDADTNRTTPGSDPNAYDTGNRAPTPPTLGDTGGDDDGAGLTDGDADGDADGAGLTGGVDAPRFTTRRSSNVTDTGALVADPETKETIPTDPGCCNSAVASVALRSHPGSVAPTRHAFARRYVGLVPDTSSRIRNESPTRYV